MPLTAVIFISLIGLSRWGLELTFRFVDSIAQRFDQMGLSIHGAWHSSLLVFDAPSRTWNSS
jgi:hypothetical protein